MGRFQEERQSGDDPGDDEDGYVNRTLTARLRANNSKVMLSAQTRFGCRTIESEEQEDPTPMNSRAKWDAAKGKPAESRRSYDYIQARRRHCSKLPSSRPKKMLTISQRIYRSSHRCLVFKSSSSIGVISTTFLSTPHQARLTNIFLSYNT